MEWRGVDRSAEERNGVGGDAGEFRRNEEGCDGIGFDLSAEERGEVERVVRPLVSSNTDFAVCR